MPMGPRRPTFAVVVLVAAGDGAKYTADLDGVCKRTNDAQDVSHVKVFPSA